jgi:hypothetical protein
MKKILLFFMFAVYLLSCEDNKNANSNSGTSGSTTITTGSKTKYTGKISGSIHTNRISGATINLYGVKADGTLTEILATTTTDKDGNYAFPTQPAGLDGLTKIMIESIGGTYVDEATGETTKGETYRTYTEIQPNVMVTPLTDVAAEILRDDAGKIDPSAIESVTNKVEYMVLGDSTKIDIDADQPASLTSDTATKDEAEYALILAGLSTLEESQEDDLQNSKGGNKPNGVVTADSVIMDIVEAIENNKPVDTANIEKSQENFIALVENNKVPGVTISDKFLDSIPAEIKEAAKKSTSTVATEIQKFAQNLFYVTGETVRSEDKFYKCKPFPEGGWCSIDAYEPRGTIGTQAWDDITSSVTGVTDVAAFAKSAFDKDIADAKAGAKDWSATGKYVSQSVVSFGGKYYECMAWPNSGFCNDKAYQPSTRTDDAAPWKQSWKELE